MKLRSTLCFLIKTSIGIGAMCPSYSADKADENRKEHAPQKTQVVITTVPLKPIRENERLQGAPERQRNGDDPIPRPSSNPIERHSSSVVKKSPPPGSPPLRPKPSPTYPRLLLIPDPSTQINNNAADQQ